MTGIHGSSPLRPVAEEAWAVISGGVVYVRNGYEYHKFLINSTLGVSSPGKIEFMLAGAGGGGGGYHRGGGGGGGRVLVGTATVSASVSVTIGVGGTGAGAGADSGSAGTNGGSTSLGSIATAEGGGRGGGGNDSYTPTSGGSGGGGSGVATNSPHAGAIAGTGNASAGGSGEHGSTFAGGGGGGAGGPGANGNVNSAGGIGYEWPPGSGERYGAGGGGGRFSLYGPGGDGGGGNGGTDNTSGVAGTPNTGGGGGGAGNFNSGAQVGGAGGSGVAIVRVPIVTATFFGAFKMFREVWAEDPFQTKPASGGAISTVTSWHDNGVAGFVLYPNSASVLWQSSAINGRPAFDHRPGGSNKALRTEFGTATGIFTQISVVQFAGLTGDQIITDSRNNVESQYLSKTAANQWYSYNSATLTLTTGTVAVNTTYIVVTVKGPNDLRLYVNGVLIGSDTSGTHQTIDGLVIGGSYGNTFGINGFTAYHATFLGDLTAATGYSTYLSALAAYYGVTI